MCRTNFWRKKERKKERKKNNNNKNITRFNCVWMQTQKSPNDPHIRIRACGCKFHHYQPIPHFKILLDINFHWNRRPLTIWRFCWQPFWKWWPCKNDPECKFHHYQPIPIIIFWHKLCTSTKYSTNAIWFIIFVHIITYTRKPIPVINKLTN